MTNPATYRFKKRELALKYYMLGKGYHKGLEALSFAEHYHTGLRKDGSTPEIQHQVEIALFIATLKDVEDEQSCLIAALLHDVQEDHDVESNAIADKFGSEIQKSVWNLTVKFKGFRKPPEEYFYHIALDPIASIVKGCDRVHNLNSMIGVFTREKQVSYIHEVTAHFIPMLKRAADNFPNQHMAYMNIRVMLNSIVRLVQASLDEKLVRQ